MLSSVYLNRLKGLTQGLPDVPKLAIGQISVDFVQYVIECSKQEQKMAISFYYKVINQKKPQKPQKNPTSGSASKT